MSVNRVARGARPREAVIGTFLVPAAEDRNVRQLIGAVDVLTAFVKEHGLRVVGVGDGTQVLVDNAEQVHRRGRTPGSTNWSQERFWRRYRKAADGLTRPYRGTHLAARIGLVYGTFTNYLNRWGPPPGYAAPGD